MKYFGAERVVEGVPGAVRRTGARRCSSSYRPQRWALGRHVKDGQVKDAAQDVAQDVAQDAVEDVLGTVDGGGAKVLILPVAIFQRKNPHPTHALTAENTQNCEEQTTHLIASAPNLNSNGSERRRTAAPEENTFLVEEN